MENRTQRTEGRSRDCLGTERVFQEVSGGKNSNP